MDLQHSKQGLQSFPGLFFLFSVCDIIQDLGLWLDSQLTGPKTIPTPVLITHVELSFNELVLVPYLSLESSLTFKTKFKSPQPPIAWLRPLKVAPGFLSPQRADKFSRSHFFRQYTGSMVTGTWFIWPEVVKDWVISSAKKKKKKKKQPSGKAGSRNLTLDNLSTLGSCLLRPQRQMGAWTDPHLQWCWNTAGLHGSRI